MDVVEWQGAEDLEASAIMWDCKGAQKDSQVSIENYDCAVVRNEELKKFMDNVPSPDEDKGDFMRVWRIVT